MNPREKLLGLVFAGFLGVGGLWWTVDRMVVKPYQEAGKKLQANQDALEERQSLIDSEGEWQKKYRDLAKRTFGLSADTASAQMRKRLNQWLEEAGLEVGNMTPFALGRKRGNMIQIGWSIKARGAMADAVAFLHTFYRQKRLMRVVQLTFSPDKRKKGTNVNMFFKVATLVLKPQRGFALKIESDDRKLPGRVRLKYPDDDTPYYTLVNNFLMSPPLAAPTRVVARPATRTVVAQRKPTPAPRAPEEQLRGVVGVGGKLQAGLYNVKTQEVRWVRRGQKLGGGIFYYAVPWRGIVIREKDGKTYSYVPLYGTIGERKPVVGNPDVPVEILARLDIE